MPTAIVYSPVGGIITGRTRYCTCAIGEACTGAGNNHSLCSTGWTSPVDIDAADNEAVNLYVNSAVQSIRTFIQSVCCNCNADTARAVIVDLYGQLSGFCYIGSVLYGHIANPAVGNNQLYTSGLNGKNLGQSPVGPGNCGCYTGSHSHMQFKNANGSTGTPTAPCCCVGTMKGSTSIYKWVFTIPCPSFAQP